MPQNSLGSINHTDEDSQTFNKALDVFQFREQTSKNRFQPIFGGFSQDSTTVPYQRQMDPIRYEESGMALVFPLKSVSSDEHLENLPMSSSIRTLLMQG